ncbi:MAG: hypothetical protein IJ341_06890 [Bacteroidales bacterium]|nr:hypothetical protein [Bacteroidales bacterium]
MRLFKLLILALCITACSTNPEATVIFPSLQQAGKATATNEGEKYILSNNLLKAEYLLENGNLKFNGSNALQLAPANDLFYITLGDSTIVKSSEMTMSGAKIEQLKGCEKAIKKVEQYDGYKLTAEFKYNNLTIDWSAVLRDNSHYLRTEMKISAKEDTEMINIVPMEYTLTDNADAVIVNGEVRGAPLTSSKIFAGIETPLGINSVEGSTIKGLWSRATTLKTGDTWSIGAVVGLVAEDQLRRSFLAYHERERAVPYRPFIHYNSWYELNIDRNNFPDPLKRMVESQAVEVIEAWRTNMYEKHDVSIDAFVWDDGWDEFNSFWDFHIGFPNGFAKLDSIAKTMKTGMGAWLGPVGGYGESKAQRLDFWNRNHENQIDNFELSNPEYFNAFIASCSNMVNSYDFRYFKFDGISDIANATGPKNEEDAEGIINVLKALRDIRYDLFFNCSVGTWSSPFWFQYADAVWRQDQDWTTVGDQGDNREKWITYRDHMVYKNFTVASPICPINSIMTHGLIVSKYGPPASAPHDDSEEAAKGIIHEMRCAFGCGSGLIELYVDNDLMSTVGEDGELWAELAECIKWQRNNQDVLADIHWVGGNPWNGEKAEVYGWASWNGKKATLTLRNPNSTEQTFTTTLRQALDIPSYVSGKITLTDAFKNQTQYSGITGESIDIDETITFNMPAFDVVVLNGKCK